jgi:adenine deaminase
MSPELSELQNAVDVAMGRRPGSLLLKNAHLVNVFTLSVQHTHILLAGRLVAAVGLEYAQAEAEQVIDLEGRWVAPGLIDGHVHLESSLVSPAEYARGVVPRGVTGVVIDPHEIGNVAGVAGIEWLMEASEGLPLEVWVTVPSSVPSTPLETSGATLGLAEIERLLAHPRVVGVAELMNFPAILAAEEGELEKVILAERLRKSPEGHAPTLTGPALQGYLATGIASDHESTTLDLAKLVCIERHGKNGQIGKGLVTGFGLQRGALACTVGHDHHNLMAVGVSDADIITAARRLEALGGGMVAVAEGQVLAELALPIAGLMTDEPLEAVNAKLQALEAAAKALGVSLPDPYMVLSFLGLAVIPELRLTDFGLVDVRQGVVVGLFVE